MLLTPLTRPLFLLTPLREGRPCGLRRLFVLRLDFYSRPCGRGDVPGTGEVLPALYFYSRPCGRGDPAGTPDAPQLGRLFLLTPLREGRHQHPGKQRESGRISTHAPAGGATYFTHWEMNTERMISTHAPAGGATGRAMYGVIKSEFISTHAPAGGATSRHWRSNYAGQFLLTPLREGRPRATTPRSIVPAKFLLTPLREGRPSHSCMGWRNKKYFYSRPCGRGDGRSEGQKMQAGYFYSRPCGRGDCNFPQVRHEVLRQIAER